jgi:alcohol dehydrogenase class IV
MTENDKVRRYLIVTDHALDDQQLAATVQQSLAAEPCQFHLLVLATPLAPRTASWGAA